MTRFGEWRAGTVRVPRDAEQMMRYLAASAERTRAVKEAGLKACAWMEAFDATDLPDDPDAMRDSARWRKESPFTPTTRLLLLLSGPG